ncbi:hypothetical protein EHS25_007128 [Saitozyma podzolica]|uniref:Xylanolytic transcriptional activator regulatory domain-containing protein n=1 Tax=Saitozyma podzolica TaxID=1890683 RepID=A0A427XP87_9TREE|nr:hypothetical protein EHS25_007128 [Saitozyma podzolica]
MSLARGESDSYPLRSAARLDHGKVIFDLITHIRPYVHASYSHRASHSSSPQLGLSRLRTSSLSPRRTAVIPSGENRDRDGTIEHLDESHHITFPTPRVDPALASPLQDEPSIPPVRSRCATSPPPGPCRSTLMDLDRILPKSTLLQAHLNAWFRFVHPCQGSGFLHRGILLRDVREGTASKKLVMAVCAAAGRFFNGASTAMGLDPTKPLKPESWTYHAKNMVLMEEEVSLDNVATCLVLSRHFTHCGRLSLADSLAATATRQAAMIRLLDAATYSSLSWVEQEYRRRLAWACFCFERLAPIGNTVLTHVPRDPVKLQLPTEDHTYQLSIPTETPSADFEGRIVGEGSLNNVGMMGQLVVLLGMQDEASSSSEQSCQPWNPLSPHAMILTRLQQWRHSLPSFLELTADNAYARSLQGEETPLALLHARYCSIMWGLYRVALPAFPESASAALMDLAPQS